MLIAVCGKSNTGKTTMFSSASLVDAEISNRIFTTIQPNKGVSYVRAECPCKKLGVTCNPKNSKCVDGVRLIPVKLIDIAGLVPGAHEGRGLGNKFLTDIMEANCLIHVVDISGSTDDDGNPVAPGSHNPLDDVKFFEEEIEHWIFGIIRKNWEKLKTRARTSGEKLGSVLYSQLSGLNINPDTVNDIVKKIGLAPDSDDSKLLEFSKLVREQNKPIIIAANKMDIPTAEENLKKAQDAGIKAVPTCAAAELALRKAAEKGVVKYTPGDSTFEITGDPDDKQKKGLELMKKLLEKFSSTGVQKLINSAVFDLLDLIVVYPVENENKFSSKTSEVLPDAYLVPRGSTVLDLAYKIHTDIGEKFIGAINARDKKRMGKDHVLQDNDIIKILTQ